MPRLVHEIMNGELFSLRSTDIPQEALELLITLGVTAAPVLDDEDKPIGLVSLRDLARARDPRGLPGLWTAPVATISAEATITAAAEELARTGYHHLVVTAADGRAVGFVGALDVLRGLLGKPVPHPAAFPNYDERTGLSWSCEANLDRAGLALAPAGPGLYMLVRSVAGEADRTLWAHASSDVRARLGEYLDDPSRAPPHLREPLENGELRFRSAAAPSLRSLGALVERLTREFRATPDD